MLLWSRRRGIIMGDDPPYLVVGTEVSAKYKGAFCEAKVRKVVRSVKCKVTFKLGLGTAIITDDQIRGTLRVGATCEAKHPEKKEFLEATINKIQDCSQYTVVFDDGDITTLRRTALCLKSGRHFAESETLDQLPLTHPEHFSNPVIGGRKGRRSRQAHDDSSEDEETPKKGKQKEEKEADIGKVVCVELGDKKKQKDNWFPGLVVAPTAQDTVRIRVRDEYLVRSFKDGRYFTVPKKEATQFTREIGAKVDNHTLKAAVEKALMYLDKDELPPHWDRDLLFGLDESSGNSDTDAGFDSDSSDDEPREEKDHFVAQLYKFMDDRGTPINKGPIIGSRDVDLYKLFKVVHKLGGYNRVTNHNQWKMVSHKVGYGTSGSSVTNLVKQSYKKFLHSFEDFYRKLGCTMVNHPRGHRSRHRGGRSLIRDCDRATPIHINKEKAITPVSVPSTPTSAFGVVSVGSMPASVISCVPCASGSVACAVVATAASVEATPKAEVAGKPSAATEKLTPEKYPFSRKPCIVTSKDTKPGADTICFSENVISTLKSAEVDGITSDKVSIASCANGANTSVKVGRDAQSVPLKVELFQEELQQELFPVEVKSVPKLELTVVPKAEPLEIAKDDKHLLTSKVEAKDDILKGFETIKKQLEENEEKPNMREAKKEDKSKDKELRGRTRETACEMKQSEEVAGPSVSAACVEKVQAVQERVKPAPVEVSKPKLREGAIKVKGKLKKGGVKGFATKVGITEKIILRKKLKDKTAKEVKGKIMIDKKPEEQKKKIEKKPEQEKETLLLKPMNESCLQTRSKSKEDARALKKELTPPERKSAEVKVPPPVRDTRTPIRDSVERIERRPRETRTPIRDTRTPVRDTVERKLAMREAPEKKPTTREVIEKKLGIRDSSEKKAAVKDTPEKKAVLRDSGEKKPAVRESERRPSVRDVDKKIAPREIDKKAPMRLKKPDEQSPLLIQKKRGRRRKDTEENPAVETLGLLPNNIRVGVGDKLKVYYGPTQESKVTYEAKVLEIEMDSSETMYLVHYTGWNTRYDEWIKRGRIAENLSWTPARAKRLQHQGSYSKVTKRSLGKRGRPSLSGRSQEMCGSQPPRSTTPSSVTSCSSRTKSPATPTTPHLPLRRTLRNTSAESLVQGFEFRRRTRRSSGLTDISLASVTETEDEEDDDDDDDEDEDEEEEEDETLLDHDALLETFALSELLSVPLKNKKETDTESEPPTRRKALRKDEDGASKKDEPPADDVEEKKRPRRSKKCTSESEPNHLTSSPDGPDEEQQEKEKKMVSDLKGVSTSSEALGKGPGLSEEDQQPRGRDFDLNQIRSELKGIERAVTLEPNDALVLQTEDKDSISPILSPAKISEESVIKCDSFDSVGIVEIAENSSSKYDDNCDSSTEDVYEFKEPEPFEFEVRTKRELQDGRRPGRIFDEVVESRNDKSPIARKRPRVKVENMPQSGSEVKRRYRRTGAVGRKTEQASENISEVQLEEDETLPNSVYEDVFDKLCQVKKPCNDGKTTSDELGPLSLFGEFPGESQDDECEEDSDDRLVISEAEETTVEGEGPLFSHSKLFPNLISSESPALVLESESSQPLDHKTQEPQKQSLVADTNLFSSVFKSSDEKRKEISEQQDKNKNTAKECSAKDHNNVVGLLSQPKMVEDFEEDPINAAIQRVFERSLTDEDSSQDIFGEKSQPDNFQLIFSSKEAQCIRKPTFEEEVLSDSSDDEESRLIIATKENEDVECLGESRDETVSEGGPSEEPQLEDDEATQDAIEIVEDSDQVTCKTELKEDAENVNRLKLEDDVKSEEQNQEQKASVLKAWLQDSVRADSWLYSSNRNQDLSSAKVETVTETVGAHKNVVKQETLRHHEDVKSVHSMLIETVLGKTVPDDVEQAKTSTLDTLGEKPSYLEETKELKEEPMAVPGVAREDVAPVLQPEAGKLSGEDMDTGLCSLLCEETIPGSPPTLTAEHDLALQDGKMLEMPFASAPGSNCAPSSVFTPVEFPAAGGHPVPSPSQAPGKRMSGEAAPVLDNTPPATPTSSLSTASGSPRTEPERLSPSLDHDSTLRQGAFTIELENRTGNKTGHYSEEDSLLNIDMSSSSDARLGKKGTAEQDKESCEAVGKKRRHSRKRSECENKRSRHVSSRNHLGSSDTDDTSENSAAGSTPLVNPADSLVSRSPRPSKYNFYVELDPDMDGSQRIALLQQNLQELRKAYNSVKSELALIDRRRKKLRRREREEKALKQEVSCS